MTPTRRAPIDVAGEPPERIGRRDAIRWVLRKQHLAGDGTAASVAEIAADLIGLHATDPLSPYLSLLARMPGFEAHLLDRELQKTHAVARVPAMRNTLFLVARPLVATVLVATRGVALRSSWRFFASRLSREQYEGAAPEIVRALRGRELTVSELRRSLGLDCDVSAVVKLLCDEGILIRAHPVGGRRAAQHTYALVADWLPDLDLTEVTQTAAVTALVRGYIASYGPVSEDDIAWWVGVTKRSVRAALAELHDELATVDVVGSGSPMLMLRPDRAELAAAGPAGPAPLALVPQLDPYLQGYRGRGRYLDRADAPFVVDRTGNTTSTILLDGRVVGVWDTVERPSREVRLHLLAPLDDRRRLELRALAERTGRFLLEDDVGVTEYATMIPLAHRPGWVRSPLQGASEGRPLGAARRPRIAGGKKRPEPPM
jgi:hypothetical protein